MLHLTIVFILAQVLLLGGLSVIALSEENNTIENESIWYEDWDAGMANAEKEKKPVLVDFSTEWCGACKAMDKNVFTDSLIQKRLKEDWVSIKINPGHSNKTCTFKGNTMNYAQLAKYFRVVGVPAFIFIDKSGELVQSVVGYKDKEEFGLILDYMKDEAYKKGISFREYVKDRGDSGS